MRVFVSATASSSGTSAISATTGAASVFNVDSYGAVPCAYYTDGIAAASTTNFTSATAAFVASDVGKWVCLEKAGASQFRRFITTIASVTNGTTVVLAAAPGRNVSSGCRFYISRGGDALSSFQAAVDDCAAKGGGKVICRGGYEFGAGSLVLKNKVYLDGQAREGTLIFQQGSLTNQGPVIRNDYTSNDGAQFTGVSRLSIDGNTTGNPSANATTTLSAAYTVGLSAVDVTSAANFTPSGILKMVQGGTTTYLYYTAIQTGSGSGGTDRLTVGAGGINGFADAAIASSAGNTITSFTHCGIYYSTVPYANTPTSAQYHDPYHVIEDVAVARVRGVGIALWSQSEIRMRNCFVYSPELIGYTYGFDTFVDSCTCDGAGYAGFFIRNGIGMSSNCKSFSCGTVDATRGPGFLVQGIKNVETGSHTLVACIAQDNQSQGFKVYNADRVILAGCAAASNSVSAASAYAGVTIDGCVNGIFDFTSTEDSHNTGSPTQLYAFDIQNTDKTSANNAIRITHGAAAGSTVSTAIKPGAILTGGHQIVINGADYFDGGTFVPNDHGLLACTVNDPSTCNQAIQPTAGVPVYTKMKIPHDTLISNIKFIVQTAGAGGGGANHYFSVYSSAGQLLGVTADQTGTGALTSTGEKTVAITALSGQSLQIAGGPNVYVYIQVLAGTLFATPFQLQCATTTSLSTNFGVTGANIRSGTSGSALSNPPSSFTPSTLAAARGPALFGVT